MDHPYCYPGTDVYRNKWDIRDADLLESLERLETLNRMETLSRDIPISADGYRSLHRYLFQNIYDWAGEDRRIDTGRPGAPFCRAAFIASELEKRFAAIRAEDCLCNLTAGQFTARAAEHISELNAIHPFLDGNGRTLRGFLDILAERAGHEIDLAWIDPGKWNDASIASFRRSDYAPMRDVIASTLVSPPHGLR
jgi:cell filamentation protein